MSGPSPFDADLRAPPRSTSAGVDESVPQAHGAASDVSPIVDPLSNAARPEGPRLDTSPPVQVPALDAPPSDAPPLDAPSVDGPSWMHARLAAKRAAHTLRVLHAIELCNFNSSHIQLEHVEALCELLAMGASDECALLDSTPVKVHQYDAAPEPIVTHLVRLLLSCHPPTGQTKGGTRLLTLISAMEPILPQLMRAVDPTHVYRWSGDNVFHVMARSKRALVPWMMKLCARLMERGCDINALDFAGRTPIMLAAESGNTSAILMLHSLGADCAQQASDGGSMLHVLVRYGHYDALLNVFSDAVPGLDLFSFNHAGQTPAELADSALARAFSQNTQQTARQVAQLISLQMELFHKDVAPLIRRVLSEHMLPDLASIVVGYIDGSGLPHPTAAAAESKENDEE